MERDAATLIDIVQAARRIERYADGRNRADLESDPMLRAAVLYEILLIGEAVKRLSEGFRTGNAAVPWSQIARMRDRLIHGYDRIDHETVWKVITGSIPELIAALEPLVPREPADQPGGGPGIDLPPQGPDGLSS
jgi:uncharacterized protein with HEPN domain